MRIIARRTNSHWLAQFDDGSPESGIGPNAGIAIRDLLDHSPGRGLTIHDFKPDFSDSGSDHIVMVLARPEPGSASGADPES